MHKDIFIFLKEHEEKAKKIVDKFLDETVNKNYQGILCISGISGVGKSEIAWWCSRLLYKQGISSHVINLDRFYKVCAENRQEWRKKNNYIGHEEIDWIRVDEEIDLYNNNEIQVLIFEGLYGNYISGIKFYIEGNIESSDEFRLMRGKENEKDAWRQYVVGEEYSDILNSLKYCTYKI